MSYQDNLVVLQSYHDIFTLGVPVREHAEFLTTYRISQLVRRSQQRPQDRALQNRESERIRRDDSHEEQDARQEQLPGQQEDPAPFDPDKGLGGPGGALDLLLGDGADAERKR